MEVSMPNIQAALPILLHVFSVLSVNSGLLQSYFQAILPLWGVVNPLTLCMSLLVQPLLGLEYMSHYRQHYAPLKAQLAPYFDLYGADRLVEILNKITTSMAAWKLLHFQARLLRERGAPLLGDPLERVLDIDWTTLPSFSSKREGAEVGMNRKYRGKPCFQLSASFIHKVFVDAHLFPGDSNSTLLKLAL
jgi:hypothetical protein